MTPLPDPTADRDAGMLAMAREALAGMSVLVLSDGKAGDEVQCLGLCDRLGIVPDLRRVALPPPWSLFAPHLGLPSAQQPGRRDSPLVPPFPDLAIASGRRTLPYLLALKRAAPACFTVYLKDPRIGMRAADFIWVPEHDRLRGTNVMVTLTSPHRVSLERLAAERLQPPPWLERLPRPRVALLIGGRSRHFRFGPADTAALGVAIRALAGTGAGLMASASRRTPPALAGGIRRIVETAGGYFWDGSAPNPYLAMLAHADAVVVTADSVNMVGEAVATGRPVQVFRPVGGSRKIDAFLNALGESGAIRPFNGQLEPYSYEPVDATPAIAAELARRYLAFRAARAA